MTSLFTLQHLHLWPLQLRTCDPGLQSLGTSHSRFQDHKVSLNVPTNFANIAWDLHRTTRFLLSQKPCWWMKEWGWTGVGHCGSLCKSNEETQTYKPNAPWEYRDNTTPVSEVRHQRGGQRPSGSSTLHVHVLGDFSGSRGLFRVQKNYEVVAHKGNTRIERARPPGPGDCDLPIPSQVSQAI